MEQSWPAPAKINLYLHVTGRRNDGYHTLDTLFQFLDFGDDLFLEVKTGGRIERRTDLPLIPEDRDLAVRAARVLQKATGCRRGVSIALTKRTPVGGGLGGGSSDAATVLLALDHLWRLDLGIERLANLGGSLGADVPVFVRGHAARATGVGDVLEPQSPAENWYLLVIPPVSVGTGGVFAAWDRQNDLTPPGGDSKIRDFRAVRSGNDLEPIVRGLYPEVDNAMNWLAEFGYPQMAGSGASVFLELPSVERGTEILAALPATIGKGLVVRGINRHPVHVRLYGGALQLN